MLFPERKSGLVRLSDAVKIGLECCRKTSQDTLRTYTLAEPYYTECRQIAQRAERGEIGYDEADKLAAKLLGAIPDEMSSAIVALQAQLHSQSLTTILTCCFCLESYINSFGYFLFKESDFLGLSAKGRGSSADAILNAVDRLSAKAKWETFGRLGGGPGFDRSKTPFQDFQFLFNFRDDHVHDKAVPYSDDRAVKRYNRNFPDPVLGLLDLGHALYAAEVYWKMAEEIHRLTGVEPQKFRRHYNLKPWFDSEHLASVRELTTRYRKAFPLFG